MMDYRNAGVFYSKNIPKMSLNRLFTAQMKIQLTSKRPLISKTCQLEHDYETVVTLSESVIKNCIGRIPFCPLPRSHSLLSPFPHFSLSALSLSCLLPIPSLRTSYSFLSILFYRTPISPSHLSFYPLLNTSPSIPPCLRSGSPCMVVLPWKILN